MQRPWDIEQLEKRGARLVCRRARRARGHAHSEPSHRGADFEACRPTANTASRIVWQIAEGARDARCHIAQRCDLGEVDAHRAMACFAHCEYVGIQQAALAKAAWSREADGDPVGCGSLQVIELGATVDQTTGADRALIVERIHRTEVYGINGQV
jgi:hypothetical protein